MTTQNTKSKPIQTDFELLSKEEILKMAKGMCEEARYTLSRAKSPKVRRYEQRVLDYWSSVIHYIQSV